MVFGCGVKAGVYCFYANEQVVHDTNLIAEVCDELLKFQERPAPSMVVCSDSGSSFSYVSSLAFLSAICMHLYTKVGEKSQAGRVYTAGYDLLTCTPSTH